MTMTLNEAIYWLGDKADRVDAHVAAPRNGTFVAVKLREIKETIIHAIADEREECCKDICLDCKNEFAVFEDKGTWFHGDVDSSSVPKLCWATRIRERK